MSGEKSIFMPSISILKCFFKCKIILNIWPSIVQRQSDCLGIAPISNIRQRKYFHLKYISNRSECHKTCYLLRLNRMEQFEETLILDWIDFKCNLSRKIMTNSRRSKIYRENSRKKKKKKNPYLEKSRQWKLTPRWWWREAIIKKFFGQVVMMKMPGAIMLHQLYDILKK